MNIHSKSMAEKKITDKLWLFLLLMLLSSLERARWFFSHFAMNVCTSCKLLFGVDFAFLRCHAVQLEMETHTRSMHISILNEEIINYGNFFFTQCTIICSDDFNKPIHTYTHNMSTIKYMWRYVCVCVIFVMLQATNIFVLCIWFGNNVWTITISYWYINSVYRHNFIFDEWKWKCLDNFFLSIWAVSDLARGQ